MAECGHDSSVRGLKRWWSVDLLLVGWLAATVVLVLLFRGRIPNAGWVAAGHLLALAVYLAAKSVAARNKLLLAVYLISPFLLGLGIFQAMGLILPHLREGTADATLAEWDVRLFGSDPTRWLEGRIGPGWAGLLQYCYLTYYVIFVVVAVAVWRRTRGRVFLSHSGAVIGCLLTTYLGYYLVPAYGPRTHFVYDTPLPLEGAAAGIHRALDEWEYIKLDAFPSGHTALSVFNLLLLFRMKSFMRWYLVLPVLGVIASTVVLRYHYAIDVVAGLLCTLLWFPWGLRLTRWIDTPRRHHEA